MSHLIRTAEPVVDHQPEWKPASVAVISLTKDGPNEAVICRLKGKKYKFVSIIWLLVCTILFSTHLIQVTENYLNFLTTTEVKTTFSRNFSPPIISFCRPLLELMHVNSKNFAFCNRNKFSHECEDYLYEQNSLKDIMDKETLSLKDSVINVADGKLDLTAAVNGSQLHGLVHEFYKSHLKCMKITRHQALIDFYQTTGWNEADLKTVMKTTINISDIRRNFQGVQDGSNFHFYKPFVGIIFHNFLTIPHYPDYDIYWYDYDRKDSRNSYQFSFDSQYYHLLPSPYSGECVDYDDVIFDEGQEGKRKFVSRGDCFETCINKSIFKKFGVRNGLFTTSAIDRVGKLAAPYKNIYFDSDINDKCFDRCHNECLTTYYLPILMNRYESMNEDRFGIRIEMYRPQTEIRYSPIFPIESYLIFVGSISGLWFGLSIHCTCEVVVRRCISKIISGLKSD